MTVTASDVGAMYAFALDRLSRDERVQALFTWSKRDDHRVWVITEPLTHAEELELYSLPSAVIDRFPDLVLTMHILHANLFANDLFEMVPPDAERQPLRRG